MNVIRNIVVCCMIIILIAGCASTVQDEAFPDQTKRVEEPTKARNEGSPAKLPAHYHALKNLKSLKDAGFKADACIREQGEDTEILIAHRKGVDKILTRPEDETSDREKRLMEALFVVTALHDVRINANDDWTAVRVVVVLPMRVYSANLNDLLRCKGRLRNRNYKACLVRVYLANPIRDDLDPWPDCNAVAPKQAK